MVSENGIIRRIIFSGVIKLSAPSQHDKNPIKNKSEQLRHAKSFGFALIDEGEATKIKHPIVGCGNSFKLASPIFGCPTFRAGDPYGNRTHVSSVRG